MITLSYLIYKPAFKYLVKTFFSINSEGENVIHMVSSVQKQLSVTGHFSANENR